MPFIIGLMTVSYIEGVSKIMVLYGGLFVFLYLLYIATHSMIRVPPEVGIFFAWIVWSLTGLSVATDQALVVEQLKTIFQIGILLFLISGITALRQNITFSMLAMIMGSIIILLMTYISGEFQEVSNNYAGVGRVSGIAENSNAFAYSMLLMLFCIFYFWGVNRSWLKCFILSVLVLLAMYGIVYSGSRKGFLGAIVFLFLWWLFCISKKISKNKFKTTIGLIFLLLVIYCIFDYMLANTFMGIRFTHMREHGTQSRIQMYVDGLEMIREHPIFGVGLDNYRVRSSSWSFSHSEYIEVASTTGIVGFIIYFSIYIVLWRRLRRTQKMTKDPFVLYMIGLLKAIVITILLVAFGRPNIISKETWILLAIAIGYSWSIEHALSTKSLSVNSIVLHDK